jgi:hypothetical protein
MKIWPLFSYFFTSENFDFSATTYGQIWPFLFFGPGNPAPLILSLTLV